MPNTSSSSGITKKQMADYVKQSLSTSDEVSSGSSGSTRSRTRSTFPQHRASHHTLRRSASQLRPTMKPGKSNFKVVKDLHSLIQVLDRYKVPHLSQDLFDSTFKRMTLLSETGMQAKVFKTKWIVDNFSKDFVLKRFQINPVPTPQDRKNLQFAINEFKVIKRIRNATSLAQMHFLFYTYDSISKKLFVWIVMDLYRDFFDYLTAMPSSPRVGEIYLWFCELTKAVDILHSNDILHRDIKIDNFLLGPRSNDIFLADFGLLCDLRKKDECSDAGTIDYAAPEIFINYLTTTKTDICSLGISFWVIWKGQPFYSEKYLKFLNKNQNPVYIQNWYTGEWKRNFDDSEKPPYDPWNLWRKLKEMCYPDPSLRPSARDLVAWVRDRRLKYPV
jgi:serine/threonine protein kinase